MHNMLNYINNDINRDEHKRDMIGYQSKNARTLTKKNYYLKLRLIKIYQN